MPFGDPIRGRIRLGLLYVGPRVAPLTDDPALLIYLGLEKWDNGYFIDSKGHVWTPAYSGWEAHISLTTGKVGNGVQFSYNNRRNTIATPYDVSLCPSIFSISLWFKITSVTAQTQPGRILYHNWYLSTNKYGIYLSISGGGTYLGQLFLALGDATPTMGTFYGATDLRDYQWHHVVVTYDSTTAEIFVDNISVGTLTKSIVYSPSAGISIGCDGGAANSLGGILDEFYLFSKVLSASERTRLYAV